MAGTLGRAGLGQPETLRLQAGIRCPPYGKRRYAYPFLRVSAIARQTRRKARREKYARDRGFYGGWDKAATPYHCGFNPQDKGFRLPETFAKSSSLAHFFAMRFSNA